MSTFTKYEAAKKSRSKGCPRCGAEKNAGAVSVQLQKLGDKGQLVQGGGGRLASRSRSLCESCSVDVYESLLATLDTETGR